MRLSVEHQKLSMIRFEVDGVVTPHCRENGQYCIDVNTSGVIEIFFEPWKIKPLVRIDDHLIDYWSADVVQFDHMVRFNWDQKFYQRYQQKSIQGKIDYLNLKTQEDIDYYLGINNSNQDIVTEIKQYLK